MTWQEWLENWQVGWRYLYRSAEESFRSAVESNPQQYAPQVEAFVRELEASRRNLDRLKTGLPNPPRTAEEKAQVARYVALEARYAELSRGFYADAKPAHGGPQVGFTALVVAGLVVGSAAIIWSIPGYEYAVNLREQTALAVKELEARAAASKDGRTLQAPTVPVQLPVAPKTSSFPRLGTLLLGGLAVGAGVLVLPALRGKA